MQLIVIVNFEVFHQIYHVFFSVNNFSTYAFSRTEKHMSKISYNQFLYSFSRQKTIENIRILASMEKNMLDGVDLNTNSLVYWDRERKEIYGLRHIISSKPS